MSGSDLYTIGEVAAMLGVSAHTVRAWERRHGILEPVRTPSRHRRYTSDDINLLREIMRAVALEGLSVRLAFETVTGRQQRADVHVAAPHTRRPRGRATGDQDMWQAVADALPEVIVVIDLQGTIMQANVATARISGGVRQQLIGRSFTDLVEPFDREKAELLYRPRPRAVTGWELNLATPGGVRLYRVESRTLNQGGETRMALVGSEMFPGPATRRRTELRVQAPAAADTPTTTDVFRNLLDGLPFGVAVTTIGSEPRVVYANRRLTETVARTLPDLTGRKINELLPEAQTLPAFRKAAAAGIAESLKDVAVIAADLAPTNGRVFDVVFQPLFSSAQKIASMLVILEDTTGTSAAAQDLARSVVDRRFVRAHTSRQLGESASEDLRKAAPGTDFAVAIATPGESAELAVVSSKSPVHDQRPVVDALGLAVRRVAETGVGVQARVAVEKQRFVVSASPLGRRRKLGAVAWVRPHDQALTPDQRTAVNGIVDRLAIAVDLLNVRAEAARKTSRLQAIIKIASVVREGGDRAGLSARFLQRLTEIINADAAAIGRVDGSDFVVEAAYAQGGAHAKPGDRFPLAGQFVSSSVESGEATGTTVLVTQKLPPHIKMPLSKMRRGIAVPLTVDGHVDHVIILLRTSYRPFEDGDVLVAQAVSSVALLALSVGGGDLQVSGSGPRAARRRSSRL